MVATIAVTVPTGSDPYVDPAVPLRQFFGGAMAITLYGVFALTFMMVMYALERRGRVFVLGFVLGCLLSSAYGFLSGAWPFGVVELIWAGIALRRFREPLVQA